MSRDFDIVISGAGVVGALIATLLTTRKQEAPPRIAIVAKPPPEPLPGAADWDLRVFALSRASQRLLDVCGIWHGLPPQRTCAYERMCVWDANGEAGGAGSLTFDSGEFAEPNLGHIVDGRVLQDACLAAALRSGVVLIDGALTSAVADADGMTLRMTDGRRVRTSLLIAADGSDSVTRTLLGIETAGHGYQQDAIVAHIRTQQPHRNTAWQRFLPTGPVALLPLRDGRSSVVWSVARGEAARLRALAPADFAAALTAATGAVLGACELTTPLAGFALQMQYALRYTAPRAVLVGDAAHVIHPLAGQGLNLGVLDCATLAEVLAGSTADAFGDQRLLRRYERRRRGENLAMATALDGLERLFASNDPVLSTVRMTGLGVVARLPSLQRQLIARALGIAGDVPEFLTRELAAGA